MGKWEIKQMETRRFIEATQDVEQQQPKNNIDGQEYNIILLQIIALGKDPYKRYIYL